jgi:hypothetical protein
VKACLLLPRLKVWCLQGSERTSISEQQSLIWKYLPRSIKAMNGKARHGWAKVNYSQDSGFASRILVFPNRSEMHFITYNMDPKEYQGWQLGATLTSELAEVVRRTPDLFNLGAWADEDMPVEWFRTVELRCTTRNACWMWTFSTTEGITTTIKEVVDGARTIRTEAAELLPDNQRHVEGCPPGHMPVVQESRKPGVSIVYFHSVRNPFPPNYENVKNVVAGKPVKVIMRDAYGYSEDTRHRCFPKFGSVNIVEEWELPAEGTNYMFCDPAGARNWFCIWARVTPGNPGKVFIYREWPDEGRYGQWAVPSRDPQQFDGDAGPGQKPLGLGYVALKRVWRELETIQVPAGWREGNHREHKEHKEEGMGEGTPLPIPLPAERGEGEGAEGDNHRGHGEHKGEGTRLRQGYGGQGVEGEGAEGDNRGKRGEREMDPQAAGRIREALANGESVENLREAIRERYIDPRAGRDQRTAQEGGTCPIDELGKQSDEEGPMWFIPAPGLTREAGLQAVNDLLDWDPYAPRDPVMNEPRLFVVKSCGNMIWMFMNNTASGGEKAGCKDPEDVARYLATSGVVYVDPKEPVGKGQGSY